MGKVEAFVLKGIECWFYSQDHRPPHFHAKKSGEWHFRIFFLTAKEEMLERVKGADRKLKARDRDALCDMTELYREELLIEWERKVVRDE